MINFNQQGLKLHWGWLRLLPYLALGALIFAFNSTTSPNYFVKGYLTILESQIGIVLIYFLMRQLFRKKNLLVKYYKEGDRSKE